MPRSLSFAFRVAVAFLGPAAVAAAFSFLGWAPAAIPFANTFRLFIALAAIILFSTRWREALQTPEPYGPREYASLGLLDVFVAFILASIWSARAGAAVHLDFYAVDIGLRLAFALHTIRGVFYLLLAQGSIRETAVPRAGWSRALKIAIAALIGFAVVSLAGQAWDHTRSQAAMHDASPVGPDTDGMP